MTSAARPTVSGAAAPPAPRLRQTMAGLHTWVGLLLGWVLYAMFLTGTVAYFKDELSQWMRPELSSQASVPDPALVTQRMADRFAEQIPGATQWSIRVADARTNSVYAFWRTPRGSSSRRGFGEGNFDPETGQELASRATTGGDFFYRFHFQFHYMPVAGGRWLAGAAAMFMLVALLSGVITHKKIFVDFFTFRWGKGQRSWLDAHTAFSVFGLPFHLMITYTGLITLMAMYMPWGERMSIRTPAERAQLTAQLSPFIQPGKPSGEAAPLAPIDAMVREAQARWGKHGIGRVTVTLPGDAASRVAVARGEPGRVSMSPQYLLFEGHTGQLLEVHDEVGGAAEIRGVLYALHLGRFSDTATRWLYFLVSLGGTAMVGTGLALWTVTRRQKLAATARPHAGMHIVERLNVAGIAGLSIAMTVFLWANRLLPSTVADRADWEIHAFFIAWALALAHAIARPAMRAWIEQLSLAAALLALLPVLNAATTARPFWHSLVVGDWVFAATDLVCIALAALHAALAMRVARHQPRLRAKAGRLRGAGQPAGQR